MKKDISDIDVNFKLAAKAHKEGMAFFDAKEAPFKIKGVMWDGDGPFTRMPVESAEKVSGGVAYLNFNTAGGRVRFKTDSCRLSIIAKMHSIGKMPHFALCGSAGFDVYIKDSEGYKFASNFIPRDITDDGYESTIGLGEGQMQDITLNMPLYSGLNSLLIGIDEGARLEAAPDYLIEKPIVYYGSSITQGGCASRAGNSYPAMISRRFDCNYINLGFSGNARGEDEMAEYIKGLDMSVFVYDYDHNAPTTEHLAQTHEKMFRTVREAQPNLPIIIMGRPKYDLKADGVARFEIIKSTYENAVRDGDKNVYLLSGRELMEFAGRDGTVDAAHPNDLGFASMAKAVGDVLEKILQGNL